MFQGDFLVYAQQEDFEAHLNQAKKDYLSGNYEKMVNQLERVPGLAEDEDKEFLEKPVIEGLDFSNLIESQRIILGKKIKAKKLVKNKKVIEKPGKKIKRKL